MKLKDQSGNKMEAPIRAAYIGAIAVIVAALIGAAVLIFIALRNTSQSSAPPAATVAATHRITYKIMYKNINKTRLNDVTVRATLHGNVQYVGGSTQVATSATNGKWTLIADNGIVGSGINIGSYAPNGNGYIKFMAYAITDCNQDNGTDEVSAISDSGGDTIQTMLQVTKEC